jgi:hypothetical protein
VQYLQRQKGWKATEFEKAFVAMFSKIDFDTRAKVTWLDKASSKQIEKAS